jgi:hypothetical protein
MLAGKVPDNDDEQTDPAVSGGVSARADDHRHTWRRDASSISSRSATCYCSGLDEISAPSGTGPPDIARPGIGADQIRLAVAAGSKAAGLDRREAEMPVRASNPRRMVG